MKVRVINRSSDYFDSTIDVKFLNYKYVFGFLSGGYTKVKLPFEDVEFIFEHEWEESMVKHRDILKISLPKAVSLKLYSVMCYAIEQHLKGEIKSIAVLSDINEKARRGFWYKKLDMLVNQRCPVSITISGKNYSDLYNIDIEDRDADSFIYGCRDGIRKLRELIDRNTEQLELYERALNDLMNPNEDKPVYKAIGGR